MPTPSPRRQRARRATACAALAATCAATAATAIAATPGGSSAPRKVIEQTVDQVLGILRDEALTHDERRRRIEDLAYQRFDLDTMARLVLARSWRRFSDTQRDAYRAQFRQHLAHTYGGRIERYEQQDVAIVGEREEVRGDVTVLTKIVGGDHANATVDYRLRRRGDQWKVIDVTVEGISLVSNYRDQFKAVVSRDGPDGLIERLREKNAEASAKDLASAN